MALFIFGSILLVEIFSLANKGGGPLMSHLILAAAVFGMVCFAVFKKIKFSAVPRWPWAMYILFLTWFFISLGYSETPQFGAAELLLFAGGHILFYFIATAEISEKHIEKFSWALIAIAVIDTLIGFFLYTRTAFPRLAGSFLNPAEPQTAAVNAYANFILLILPFAFSQLFKKHERRTTDILMVFASSILLTGFLLSFSRAAWIALAAVLIICGIVKWRKWREWATEISYKKCIAVLAFTVVLCFGLQYTRSRQFETTSLVKKLLFQADEGAASASYRMEYWRAALPLIAERPFVGHGIQSFRYLFPKYQQTFGVRPDHPHNIVLKIAVENGIPAAIFLVVFFATILLRPRIFSQTENAPMYIAASAALIHNFLDFNFIVANFVIFIVWLALLAAYRRS